MNSWKRHFDVTSEQKEGAPAERGLRPVSYSELNTFRQCPMKWELGYKKGYKPKREKEAFRLGHIWHEMMQVHYGVIKEYQDAEGDGNVLRTEQLLEWCAREVGGVLDKTDETTRELMNWAYAGYVEVYGCDPQWRILAIEIRGQVELTPGSGIQIVYVIDLVVEDSDYGGIWIIDHKFPGDLASDTEIELDDQLGLYWGCWIIDAVNNPDGLIKRVNGAMLNEARKKRNVGDLPDNQRGTFKSGKLKGTPQTLDQRFRRSRTSRTDSEALTIAQDAARVVKAMIVLDANDLLYSSPDPKQCGWKCDFDEVHILSRSSEIPLEEILSDFGFQSRAEREAEGE